MFGSGCRADSPPPDSYAGQIERFGQTGLSETAVLGGMKGRTPAMSQTGQIGSEPATSRGFLDSEDISEGRRQQSWRDQPVRVRPR
jgi:hypothetical protein